MFKMKLLFKMKPMFKMKPFQTCSKTISNDEFDYDALLPRSFFSKISKNIYEISKFKKLIQLRKISIKNFIQLHDLIKGFI